MTCTCALRRHNANWRIWRTGIWQNDIISKILALYSFKTEGGGEPHPPSCWLMTKNYYSKISKLSHSFAVCSWRVLPFSKKMHIYLILSKIWLPGLGVSSSWQFWKIIHVIELNIFTFQIRHYLIKRFVNGCCFSPDFGWPYPVTWFSKMWTHWSCGIVPGITRLILNIITWSSAWKVY